MAERNTAVIEAAKTFLQMFVLYIVFSKRNMHMNPIKDSIPSHSARTMVGWHGSFKVRFLI